MILYYRMHARVRLRRRNILIHYSQCVFFSFFFFFPLSFLLDASYYYHHLLDLLFFPPPLSPSFPCTSLHSVTQLVIWEKGVVYVIVCVCYINLNFGKLETKLPHFFFFFFFFLFHAGCFSTPEFRVELKTFCQCPSY